MSNKERERMIENLKDAGFTKIEVQKFMEFYNNNDSKSGYKCLSDKRKKILEKVHKNEKCITYLDYLRHTIEKKEKRDTNESKKFN